MSSEVETSLTVSVARLPHGQTIVRDSSTPVGMTEKLFASLDVYHDESSRSAALNMAIDEALLETATGPVIRFYQWDHQALSFGYFGKFAEAAGHETERDLVRRWTGGGIVLHGKDLTYSIIIPASDIAFGESTMSVYEKTHAAICVALAKSGKNTRLAESAGPKISESCFANAVRADVLWNGQKVAGAAQRRTRRGLLQQGSIQGVDLASDFGRSFASELSESWSEKTLEAQVLERAVEIAAQKYASVAWLRRR